MRNSSYPSFSYDEVPGGLPVWQEGTFTYEQWRELFHPGRRAASIDIVCDVVKKGVEDLSPAILEGAYLVGRRDVMDALVANPNFGQQQARWLYERATDDLVHLTQILEYTHTGDYDLVGEAQQKDQQASRTHKMNQSVVSGRAYFTFRALVSRKEFPAPPSCRNRWLEHVLEGPRFSLSKGGQPRRAPQTLAWGLIYNSSTTEKELLALVQHLAPSRWHLCARLLGHSKTGGRLVRFLLKALEEEERLPYARGRFAQAVTRHPEYMHLPEVRELLIERGRPEQLATLIEADPQQLLPVMKEFSPSRQEEILEKMDDSIEEELTTRQLRDMLSLPAPRLRHQALRWLRRRAGRQTEAKIPSSTEVQRTR